jgi:succinyl-diaminopimelate desuccinylase
MLDIIRKIAADLIRFSSTAARPDKRASCAEYIENFFGRAGINYTVWEPGDVRSLVVNLGDGEEPALCLHGHYDVVEGPAGAFRPRRRGDRLYGRGSADMKTSLAAMMVLVRELAKRPDPPPLALMITGDEEQGGERGAAHILKNGFACKFALAGEPTGLSVAHQSKGLLGVEIVAKGVSSHSARPWEGDNAIFSFFRQFPAVWEIFGDPEPQAWQTTMVPSILRAGDAFNRVPDRCAFRLDIRYVPMDSPEELVERIRKAAPELSVKVVEEGEAFYTDPSDQYLLCLRRCAGEVLKYDPGFIRKHAASDARHFTSAGIPAAVFGPGGENVHGDGEWVDLRQVAQFYRVLEKFVFEAVNLGRELKERAVSAGQQDDSAISSG